MANYTKRVTLPSGRSIEVVYYERTAAETAGIDASASPCREREDLQNCPACDSDLVYPVDWEATSQTHWRVELRCPNCERTEVGTFDQWVVDRFDDQLDVAADVLASSLRRLTEANMRQLADVFAVALERDLIVPEDF